MTRSSRRGEDLELHRQLLRESTAMAKFALSGGKAVPASVAETIAAAAAALYREPPPPAALGEGSAPAGAAAAGGEPGAGSGDQAPAAPDIRKLVSVHEKLSLLVAPATPQAILLLGSRTGRSGFGSLLGPVPLVGRMMLTAGVSLALFIGMALFPDVTGDISFSDADSLALLYNLLFLLAAAGLGASFAALFQVNRFIAEANYDPKFEASYWIRFALGLIAGIILAQLVPIGEAGSAGAAGTATGAPFLGAEDAPDAGISRLAKPTLALLGGFSAAVVYRILNRLVAAVDSLVRGETREIVAAQEQAAKARLAEQLAQSRMDTISKLVALQQQFEDGVASDKIKAKVAEILGDFMGADLSAGAPAEPAPADVEAKPPTTPPKPPETEAPETKAPEPKSTSITPAGKAASTAVAAGDKGKRAAGGTGG